MYCVEEFTNIETTINRLRKQMVLAYEKTGDLGDESVIALSQQLDLYLLAFQKQPRARNNSLSRCDDKSTIF
ncbi:aspartyl-phosphate phosphatase Spo0E family protein [Tumebacillus amylolyticus]